MKEELIEAIGNASSLDKAEAYIRMEEIRKFTTAIAILQDIPIVKIDLEK